MIRTHGVLHFTIGVTDLERATAFYTDVLGCELVNTNPVMSFMRTGNDLFVLTKTGMHVRPNPEGQPTAWTTLFHHALLVDPDDLPRIIAELDERGIAWGDCTDEVKHETVPGRRHIYVYDPDGNSIELATMIESERRALAAR